MSKSAGKMTRQCPRSEWRADGNPMLRAPSSSEDLPVSKSQASFIWMKEDNSSSPCIKENQETSAFPVSVSSESLHYLGVLQLEGLRLCMVGVTSATWTRSEYVGEFQFSRIKTVQFECLYWRLTQVRPCSACTQIVQLQLCQNRSINLVSTRVFFSVSLTVASTRLHIRRTGM